MQINIVAKTCFWSLFSLGIMYSDQVRDHKCMVKLDFDTFLVSDFLLLYLRQIKCHAPYLVEIWKICGFHAELQFPLAKYLKFSLNVFEATISHMVLIINELHFVPLTLAGSGSIRDLWTHSYILLTLSLFIQFL